MKNYYIVEVIESVGRPARDFTHVFSVIGRHVGHVVMFFVGLGGGYLVGTVIQVIFRLISLGG